MEKTVQLIIKIINQTPLKLEFGLTAEVVNFDLSSFAECSFNAAVSPVTISECTRDIEFELKHVIGSSIEVAGVTLTGWRVETGIFVGRAPSCGVAKAGMYEAVFGTRLRTEQGGEKINGPELVVPITATESEACQTRLFGVFAVDVIVDQVRNHCSVHGGIAVNFPSFESARAEAIDRCVADGGAQCTRRAYPFGSGEGEGFQCGAVAYGTNMRNDGSISRCGIVPGWGSTISAAEQAALSRCRQSLSNCEITVVDNSRAAACTN